MGGVYEVKVWSWYEELNTGSDVTVYRGNNFIAAIRAMWKHRNEGTGCVSFVYRRNKV